MPSLISMCWVRIVPASFVGAAQSRSPLISLSRGVNGVATRGIVPSIARRRTGRPTKKIASSGRRLYIGNEPLSKEDCLRDGESRQGGRTRKRRCGGWIPIAMHHTVLTPDLICIEG